MDNLPGHNAQDQSPTELDRVTFPFIDRGKQPKCRLGNLGIVASILDEASLGLALDSLHVADHEDYDRPYAGSLEKSRSIEDLLAMPVPQELQELLDESEALSQHIIEIAGIPGETECSPDSCSSLGQQDSGQPEFEASTTSAFAGVPSPGTNVFASAPRVTPPPEPEEARLVPTEQAKASEEITSKQEEPGGSFQEAQIVSGLPSTWPLWTRTTGCCLLEQLPNPRVLRRREVALFNENSGTRDFWVTADFLPTASGMKRCNRKSGKHSKGHRVGAPVETGRLAQPKTLPAGRVVPCDQVDPG